MPVEKSTATHPTLPKLFNLGYYDHLREETTASMGAKPRKKPLRLPVIIDPHVVRSELNLEKNTVFVPSTYRETFLVREKKETLENGEVKVQKVTVGKTKRGRTVGVLRIATHFRLILTLKKLWEEAGKPEDAILTHSLYTIAKTRRIQPNNRNYEKLEEQLYDLNQIPLEFINTWFSAKSDEFIEKLDPFHILDKLTITKHVKKQKNREVMVAQVEWRFHSNILTSLLGNHTHPIRLDVITSFRKSKDLAILFYLFADRQLAHKHEQHSVERILPNLWQEAVGEVPGYTQKSDWKKKAKPPLDEIVGKPLSSGGVLGAALKLTEDREQYKVVLTKLPIDQQLPGDVAQVQEPGKKSEAKGFTKAQQQAFLELTKIGVGKTKAETLALTIESDLIQQWVKVRSYLKADNPTGYIVNALEEGYGIPDYAAKAEAKATKIEQENEAAKKRREEQRRRDQAEQQRIEDSTNQLKTFFSSLPPEDQENIKQQAKANVSANSFNLQMIQRLQNNNENPFENLLIKAAYEDELFKILRSRMNPLGEHEPAKQS